MKTARFLLLPTLVGWVVAFAACLLIHQFTDIRGVFHLKSLALMFALGGIWLVLPTYLLVILPLSIVDLYRPILALWQYAAAVCVAGACATGWRATQGATQMMEPFEGVLQYLVFFLPFIPFAWTVAILAPRMHPSRLSRA